MTSAPAPPAAESSDLSEESLAAGERRALLSSRLALIVFVVWVVAAAALLLFHLGRYRWFFGDEWYLVAEREAGDLRDWFRPHGGHWVTGPVLIYRLMWNVFGFEYMGYQAVLLGFCVATVVLLRVVMRRGGAGPWVATITAGGLLLFGAGEDDITWAFQITFVGAFAFGVVHLLLLDHDGPIDRRDWLGLGAGLVALTFSGVGIALAIAAAIAALIRRGWRAAAFHSIPLAAAYAVWWFAVRPSTYFEDPNATLVERARDAVEWPVVGVRSAFSDYGHLTGVGVALGLLLLAGLVLAWWRLPLVELRARAAVPAALLMGGLAFLTLTGYARSSFGSSQAASSRYVYIVMASALPALAVAADAFIRRWRLSAIPIFVLLLLGIPGNIGKFGSHFPWTEGYFANQKRLLLALPLAPDAASVDPDLRPDPLYAQGVTMGWLLAQVDEGRIPAGAEATGPHANGIRLRLALSQTIAEPPPDCVDLVQPLDLSPRKGDVIGIRNQPVRVDLVSNGAPVPGGSLILNPDAGAAVTIELDGLTLRLTPTDPNAALRFVVPTDEPAQLCR